MDQTSVHYFIAQIEPGIVSWLVEQGSVIVIMGVIVWWLARRLEKVEQQKDTLAESMIKLTTLYEAKVDKNDEMSKGTIEKLEEIINLIKYGKGA